MIEGLDRVIRSAEQQIGGQLLKAVQDKAPPLTVKYLGRLYDALPVQDAQVRNGIDDALMCAGWVRA